MKPVNLEKVNHSFAIQAQNFESKDVNFTRETIFYKGIMPSEKVLDFPVDCNTLTGSVNL